MYSIAMLAFQFGKLPNYFQLWLNSAGYNNSIDFYIFTDDESKYTVPSNVHIKKMTFEEMKSRIQSKFDFKICINKPYKICDYRPAFGIIFENEILEYNFWGTVDLDVILGDIRAYATEKVLEKYNRFLTRDHFTLYRNTKEVNRRFMKRMTAVEQPYKKVFTDSSIYAFGERAPISVWNIWIDNGWYEDEYDKPIDGNIDYSVYRLRTFYDNKGKGSIFSYENGKVFEYFFEKKERVEKKEWLYIHLGRRKLKCEVDTTQMNFLVLPNKFIEYREVDEKLLKDYSGIRMWIFDKLRFMNRAYIAMQRKAKQLWIK